MQSHPRPSRYSRFYPSHLGAKLAEPVTHAKSWLRAPVYFFLVGRYSMEIYGFTPTKLYFESHCEISVALCLVCAGPTVTPTCFCW